MMVESEPAAEGMTTVRMTTVLAMVVSKEAPFHEMGSWLKQMLLSRRLPVFQSMLRE